MPPMLHASEGTYTQSRVTRIFNDESYIPPDANANDTSLPLEFSVELSHMNITYEARNIKEAQLKTASERCREYCEIISSASASDHFDHLDSAYSKLIECHFQPCHPDVVHKACHRLARLPAVPPPVGNRWADETISKMDEEYFIPRSRKTWENLKAVRYVDTNVIRLALQIESADVWWGGPFTLFTKTISTLLTSSLHLPATDLSCLSILQAFLWTSWQRSTMLLFSYSLDYHIKLGYDSERNQHLAVDIIAPMIKEIRIGLEHRELPKNICKWAFNLLRSDRAAIALDFRAFLERYDQILGHLPPRCIKSTGDEKRQCDGASPLNCTRFKGMKIEDQSAHSSSCKKHGQCKRLFWDEQSYRKQDGTRAVTIDDEDCDQLSYCTASGSTMSVSHVWSHGQGGRPEIPEKSGTGFNSCLHKRYSRIARHFGCDSYWMDTPCIPQDHVLRSEAIKNINSVFSSSKLTLVCDRDLMSIDISHRTIELSESLLSALLVCDWNVRAWTFLEASRGRSNIHLLCKDDQVVPLKEILDDVTRNGNITIATLLLTAQHLMPAQRLAVGGTPSEAMDNRARGFVPIHEASCLLSHRHATRENDEVVIWSLLCSENVKGTPIELWRSMVGRVLPTGFLMSSHPRIGYEDASHKGFGWAPRRPDMPEDASAKDGKVFFADDGSDSAHGLITQKGLAAKWLVADFDADLRLYQILIAAIRALSWKHFYTNWELRRIATQYLTGYRRGALIQAGNDPLAEVPVQYRGDSNGVLVAIIGSNDEKTWYWRGVCEWKASISLTVFRRKELVLV